MVFSTDTIVYPWESQCFGERKIGASADVETSSYLETDLYKNDLIGLKTLDEDYKVGVFLMSGDHLVINRVGTVGWIIPAIYDKKFWK